MAASFSGGVLHFGQLLLFLSLVHLSDVHDELLVFLWYKAGHHVVATLSYQPLKDNSSLEPEVTTSILTPAQDAGHLKRRKRTLFTGITL